jgi:hypothetical protein
LTFQTHRSFGFSSRATDVEFGGVPSFRARQRGSPGAGGALSSRVEPIETLSRDRELTLWRLWGGRDTLTLSLALCFPCKAKSYEEFLPMNNKSNNRIFGMKFANIYPLYVQKAERNNRTKEEVDQIICWLTGYNQTGLQRQIKQGNDFETFFAQAPAMNPNRSLIKGVVCGVRVEEIEDPLMQKIRYLDKLIDELAKGKTMEKILRSSQS